MKYAIAREPTNLWKAIEENLYHNRRHNNPKIVNKSLRKIGRKSICDWGGEATEKLAFDWFSRHLSDYTMRIKVFRG